MAGAFRFELNELNNFVVVIDSFFRWNTVLLFFFINIEMNLFIYLNWFVATSSLCGSQMVYGLIVCSVYACMLRATCYVLLKGIHFHDKQLCTYYSCILSSALHILSSELNEFRHLLIDAQI